jgi:hypothetical protein
MQATMTKTAQRLFAASLSHRSQVLSYMCKHITIKAGITLTLTRPLHPRQPSMIKKDFQDASLTF